MLLSLLVCSDTGLQALQQVGEAFLGADCGEGTLGCAGGMILIWSFFHYCWVNKATRVTEQLWQQWEER